MNKVKEKLNLTTLTKIIDELDLDFWTVCPNINAEIEAAKTL
ncbi:hypothetical protein Q5M85_10280 [Paraclostridium bifermentans]|nr:hypothetical protein [Paraclostridium bifermentans]